MCVYISVIALCVCVCVCVCVYSLRKHPIVEPFQFLWTCVLMYMKRERETERQKERERLHRSIPWTASKMVFVECDVYLAYRWSVHPVLDAYVISDQ